MTTHAFQRCIRPACAATSALDATSFQCPRCGGLMDVAYECLAPPRSLRDFEAKWARRSDPACFSGVWRFRELLPFAPPDSILTIGEGQTLLQRADNIAAYAGMNAGSLHLQYEGMNPSGSFKDNGMTAAFTHARMTGAARAACASTGNTSASLAAFCSATGLMKAVIFIGSGKISYGKLSQALDHGALTLQIAGDFDDAMQRVQQASRRLGIYLVNSINPFRLEGQKAIMYRVLEGLGWEPPDWVVVPGGNLGNASAFGKAFHELREWGLLSRVPRLAVVNAAGANTFHRLYNGAGLRWNGGEFDRALIDNDTPGRAETLASAIEINRPVNLPKALRALAWCGGAVTEATDEEILDAKAKIGAGGLGCEPASAASVAGLKRLRVEGTIAADDSVVCILTGHALKDPKATVSYHTTARAFSNRPVEVPNDLDAIIAAIEGEP